MYRSVHALPLHNVMAHRLGRERAQGVISHDEYDEGSVGLVIDICRALAGFGVRPGSPQPERPSVL